MTLEVGWPAAADSAGGPLGWPPGEGRMTEDDVSRETSGPRERASDGGTDDAAAVPRSTASIEQPEAVPTSPVLEEQPGVEATVTTSTSGDAAATAAADDHASHNAAAVEESESLVSRETAGPGPTDSGTPQLPHLAATPGEVRRDLTPPSNPEAASSPAQAADEPLPRRTVSRETAAAPEPRRPPTPAHRIEAPPARSWPRPVRPRIITVANQKGGVGKTTTTVNLGVALAQHGLRVLVIDLDPQGNASTAFNIDHHADIPSVYDVLVNGAPIAEVAHEVAEVPGLRCVPATIDLAGAEIELVSVVAREFRLSRALAAMTEPVDYVLIDCPPSLGLLTLNAMVAGHEILIPIQCEFYALEGLSQLLRNVELVKSHLNSKIYVSTVLLTMYDARTRLADQVAAEVRSHFGERVLDSVVPRSVRISEAPGFGQTVMTYDPTSRGARAYEAAAYDLAVRGAATPAAGSPVGEESR